MRIILIRWVGFILALLGIGGLAGWTETNNGLVLSLVCLTVGIFLLWEENRISDVDRKWEELEQRKRRARR